MIYLILFFYLSLKVIEQISNKFKKRSYTLGSQTNVLITGACSGIGKQIAINFAKNLKCKIFIYDILPEIPKILREELEKLGGNVFYYKCDVSKKDEIARAISQTLIEVNQIDILINNAGIVVGKSILDISLEEIEKTTNVNYLGPIALIKQILPKMQALNKGHIVDISSVVHLLPAVKLADYCGSKAALYNFHSSLRLELKKSHSKILTTVVSPFVINTGMFKGMTTKFEWIFKPLDEISVGRTIFESILEKREVVYIPGYYGNLWTVMNFLLPHKILDSVLLFLSGDSMNNFIGRSKKE